MNQSTLHQLNASLLVPLPRTVLLLILFGFSGFASAQDEPNSESNSEPIPETETVCFAAAKKWVCAPVELKQQALDQATKLIEQQANAPINPDNVDRRTAGNSPVEIKTIDNNLDFSQQVTENPADELSQQPDTDYPALNNELESSANVQFIEETKPPGSNRTSNQTTLNLTTPNDFSQWQANHPESWAFQVIGTSNQQALNQFITTHGLQNTQYSLVKTQTNGKDWWIVLVGLYDSREQALAQRQQLPVQLAKQAWVRSIKTIISSAD